MDSSLYISCTQVRSLSSSALPPSAKHQHERVTDTPRASSCISEGAQKNRVVGAHRWERGCEEAHRALLYLPPVLPRGCASRVDQNQEKLSRTHPQSQTEQTHPQNSRFTPRCPSGVLWTPCSGVEWRVSDPALKGKRHDEQAACEPGGRGSGGVPVHPARLHGHRTSPAQALLTILTETCCNALTCSRTATVVRGVPGVHWRIVED